MALVLSPEPPLTDWMAALDLQIAKSAAFFAAKPVILECGLLGPDDAGLDALVPALLERGIRLVEIEGADPDWPATEGWTWPQGYSGGRAIGAIEIPEEAPAPPPDPSRASLVIDEPVRSGQTVSFPDGDVVVMGSVASGAEVSAGGSVHVYGTLRGRAFAGAGGNAAGRILCSRLNAELVAIGGVYMTAEDIPAGRCRCVSTGSAWCCYRWIETRRTRERPDSQPFATDRSPKPGKVRRMGKVLVVTSGKGGVGKTTSTASLGAALAQNNQTVVVVDFDVGLRNLDLVMGAERRVVFDLINVVQGDAKLAQALIRDKRIETLSILPASQTRDKDALTADGVARVIEELREKFDWIVCDSPAGIERGAQLAMYHADEAVVVTNPEVSSVRDSDRIIGLLDSTTAKAKAGEKIAKHLLLTRYDPVRAARGEMLRVEDVLEILSIPLIGIIPESEEVLRASNLGSPVTLNAPESAPARAYFDAARRLRGETLDMSVPSDRKGLFAKLFNWRAA
jgi:septum site-determining protein MinD